MSKGKIDTIGRNMYYKNLSVEIEDVFKDGSFKNEMDIVKECKSGLHLLTPITLDISSSGFYLMNGVEMRLRFDLAPASVVINSHEDEYKYTLQTAKIWVQKIIPHEEALISLNKNMMNSNSLVEYIVDRPIIKTFVFPAGQSSLTADNVYNSTIPHLIHVFAIKQKSLNGAFNHNAAYLSHCNMSSIRLELNGNMISSMNMNFPDQIANAFHSSIFHLKHNESLLTLQNFKNGRTIHTWDLSPSDCNDDLNIERSGNLRLSIQLSNALSENMIIFIVGITSGLIEIDSARRVKTSYLM